MHFVVTFYALKPHQRKSLKAITHNRSSVSVFQEFIKNVLFCKMHNG